MDGEPVRWRVGQSRKQTLVQIQNPTKNQIPASESRKDNPLG
jgi:hypothetical protein